MALACAALAAVSGCSRGPAQPPAAPAADAPIALEVPGRTSLGPSIAALGTLTAVVWTASTDAVSDIYIAISRDSGATFSAPARVNDLDGDARASGEQPARIAIGHGPVIHVVWPTRQDGISQIRYASSSDLGRTFSKAVTVAGEKLSGARGWESLALGWDGGVHLAWLDGRNAAPRPNHAHHGSHANPGAKTDSAPRQDVFHAAWKGAAAPAERQVAANVCFCCKTAIATSGEKVYVAYRHIFPDSIRDIAVARSIDNGVTFEAPTRLSDDGWKIAGCPDDGPAMAADSHGGLHIAWPTFVEGETPRKGIFFASMAEGQAFTPRLRLDSGQADAAHPQIAADDHGASAVVWDEHAAGARRIVLRRIDKGAAAAPEVFAADGGLYPVVAAAEGHWVVVWSQLGPDKRQVLAGRRLAFKNPSPEP